jgi:hypothetical protein
MNTDLWRNATPEQINLWNIAKTKIAYTTITPLFFEGSLAATEFLTYNAGKIYIALELVFGTIGSSAAYGTVEVRDEADAINFYLGNSLCYWDGALKYSVHQAEIKNIWFSRITPTVYSRMKFNGYRINT